MNLLTPWSAAAVIAIIAVGALIQATTGSGFGIVTAPALILVDPHLVPGALLMLATVICTVTAWRERAWIDRGFVTRCVLAAVPGTAAGVTVVHLVGGQTLAVIIALTVVAAGCAGLCGVRVPLTTRSTLTAGFFSGALNYAAALPGPPLALTFRAAEAARIRATMSAVFAIISAATVLLLAATGRSDSHDLLVALALLVPMAAGILAARVVMHRIPAAAVARAGMALSVIAGVGLLVSSL
ncbi:sulfite exporter TauE/SafE family protein [Gordonia sp. VNQ95]|uniref:sulfite exporter TauE/SafE family protein n=1 Tax=Gordonia sp. VNQ95 TaxID=3156619 RepID=UPI0032B3D034